MTREIGEVKRVRVLQIIQNLNYGGMERLLSEIVRRVDGDRFECEVLVLQYLGRFAEGLEAHARLNVEPSSRGWSMVWPRSLTRRIRKIAPDVVHSHSGVWYKASLASRLAGVPRIVHTEHGYSPAPTRTGRLLNRLAARRTDVVVAVSEPLRDELRAGVVQDATRLRVVLNGVDTNLFRPRGDSGRPRGELGLDPGSPVIGSVGRLEPVKAYEIMVTALRRLLDRWAGAPPALVLVGEGSERMRLEALARDLGVWERVHLLGWRDDVPELHAAFTLFSLSSRSEGTSVSLLEAMKLVD